MVNDLLNIINQEAEALKTMTPGTKEYATLCNEYNKHVELYNKNLEADAKQKQAEYQYVIDTRKIDSEQENAIRTDKTENRKITTGLVTFGVSLAAGIGLHIGEAKNIFSGTTLKKIQNAILSKIR